MWRQIFGAVLAVVLFPACQALAESSEVSRGRYLIQISACNDCHTSGFAARGGAVDEAEWLQGDNLGYSGGWGTTYPTNLRSYMARLSVDDWIGIARKMQTRPPMPWWSLNAMSDGDLAAIYAYTRSLGDSDFAVPAYLPPGENPPPPFIQWPSPPPAEGQATEEQAADEVAEKPVRCRKKRHKTNTAAGC